MHKVKASLYHELARLPYFHQIVFIAELPFKVIIWITVPPIDNQLYHRYQILIYPFTSSIFFLWERGLLFSPISLFGQQIYLIYPTLIIAAISDILLLIFTVKDLKPRPRLVSKYKNNCLGFSMYICSARIRVAFIHIKRSIRHHLLH